MMKVLLSAIAAFALLPGLAGCSKSSAETREEHFSVPGMHCASCVAKMRTALREVDGVVRSRFDVDAKTVAVEIEDGKGSREDLGRALADAGFPPGEGDAPPAGGSP